MSSLLAILLVVNSTRGHHYLFSYPPDPKRSSLYKRNTKNGKDFTVGSTRMLQTEDRVDENEAEENDEKQDIFAGRDTIFNIDVTFLADTLAPKLPLCDRKFQLSMDDLTFVGHPVSLSSPQQQTDIPMEDNTEHITSPLSPLSPQNIHLSPSSPQSQPSPSIFHTNEHHDTANSDQLSESSNDEKSDQEENADNESNSNRSPGSTSIHMTLFHVVYVMSPPDLELNAQVETLYKNVILRYSSALRYEQLRCGYVQEEIEKVLGLKEEAYNKGKLYSTCTNH